VCAGLESTGGRCGGREDAVAGAEGRKGRGRACGKEREADRYDRREDLVNNARPPVVVASSHP